MLAVFGPHVPSIRDEPPELKQVIKTRNMRLAASDAETLRKAWYADVSVHEKLVEISGARMQQ